MLRTLTAAALLTLTLAGCTAGEWKAANEQLMRNMDNYPGGVAGWTADADALTQQIRLNRALSKIR